MHLSDILILLGVAALLLQAVRLIRKGKGGCGSCQGCDKENCPHRQ